MDKSLHQCLGNGRKARAVMIGAPGECANYITAQEFGSADAEIGQIILFPHHLLPQPCLLHFFRMEI